MAALHELSVRDSALNGLHSDSIFGSDIRVRFFKAALGNVQGPHGSQLQFP